MKILIYFILFSTIFNVRGQETRWSTKIDSANIFSSPRFADLNKDGVKDVIIGAGLEYHPVTNGIVALNGVNGELLWKVGTRTQIYTSALFQDITGDSVPEVFIGGRAASFYAINGVTGEIVWEFWNKSDQESRAIGWLNFFSTQWISDQNNDGFKDLLVTNGGDYLAKPKDKERPTAQLMVLSGRTGEIIAAAKIPEERESYYAPTILNNGSEPTILFGTGGETIDGGLWEVALSDLTKKKNLKKATLILHDSLKGFILNSVLTDLNNDSKVDIIAARLNATITAIDGISHSILWENSFPGYECYVTPSLGHLVGDSTLDVFTIVAKGTFPRYSAFKLVVIDGATGKVEWTEDSGFNQFSPAITVDMDNDGIDELLYTYNTLIDPTTFAMVNQLRVLNIAKNESYFIGGIRPGISMASSPGIVDLENDGEHEVIVATSSFETEKKAQYSIIECIQLNKKVESITWPGYLGPNENGEGGR
ncbi:MAG: hypothetical protein COA33_005125 [Fluviicola sp.]|nr:hypothetical protein [Fluviicola sp.]